MYTGLPEYISSAVASIPIQKLCQFFLAWRQNVCYTYRNTFVTPSMKVIAAVAVSFRRSYKALQVIGHVENVSK